MKSAVFALTALLLLIGAACSPAANGVFEAGQMGLRPGQTLDDVQSGPVLTFVEIVQDSRCPADATCMTSGVARVLLKIDQVEITREVILTLGDLVEGDVNSIEVGEWTVRLTEVNPYPLISQPVNYADYTVTLDFQAE